jgi:hypothetical protein
MADIITVINNPFIVILISALWGVTEKMADLLNEHGLKWFRGANILFGILWGSFLSLLVINQNVIISNLTFAMLLAYILRYRIDYLNHGIAAVIVIFTFLINGAIISLGVLILFFLVFSIGGLTHDALTEKPQIKKFFGRPLNLFFEYRIYIYLIPLIYSIYTGIWMVFLIASAHMLSYEIIRQYYKEIKEPLRFS